jgi:hypothetical protein
MYANLWTALGLLAGAAATGQGGGTAVAGMVALWVLAMNLTGEGGRMAYFVFGLGLVVAARLGTPEGAFVLATGWVASLSVGVPYPAMAAGAIFLMAAQSTASPPTALMAAAVLAAMAFIALRRRHIYRQPSAKALGFDLAGVLAGARGIRTSETTRDALSDLDAIIGRLRENASRYAVIPDLAAVWVRSPQRNPISCDWPQDTELGSEALRVRVQSEMDSNRDLCVVLQKFETRGLMEGLVPLPERYSLVSHARRTRPPVEETRFFTVLGPVDPSHGPVESVIGSICKTNPALRHFTNAKHLAGEPGS